MNKIPFAFFCFLAIAVFLSGCATSDSNSPSKPAAMPPPASGTTDQQPSVTSDQSPSVVDGGALTDDGSIIPPDKLPMKKGYPYAIKTQWPGLVKSPYAQDKQLVDVSKMVSGSFARCPHTGKVFVVP